MIDIKTYDNIIDSFSNTNNFENNDYLHQEILSLKNFDKAKKEIHTWEGYEATPLYELKELAHSSKVARIFYKDESHRFNLKSFKALGGAYAVANLLIDELSKKNIKATSQDLLNKKYESITQNITVSCATDGNHGKSVAWGALMFGCKCEIFIHSHVSSMREREIQKYGAIVNRIEGNYDDSVSIAAKVAKEKAYFTVSDTSYEGYLSVPKDVMQGYTIMVDETINQMKEKPTHIFLQGGVGGMAAAVISFFHETYGKDAPIFVIVEPQNAACLLESARNNTPTIIHGDLDTVMAGLSCGEVSLLAWDIIKNSVQNFLTISDQDVGKCMQYLSRQDTPIIAGESAVGGLVGFISAQKDKNLRENLALNEDSKVLFYGTEGDTDEEAYERLVGKSAQEVLLKK